MKRMLCLAAIAATLLGWGSQGLAQPSDGGKALVIAAFSGYDALMKDVAWVDNLAGKPGLPARGLPSSPGERDWPASIPNAPGA